MHTFALIGLVVSIVLFFTTEPVSKWLGPTGPGFWAFIRTFLSVVWFAFGKFFCIIAALFFALLLKF